MKNLFLIGTVSIIASACTTNYTQELPDASTVETISVQQVGLFVPAYTTVSQFICQAGKPCELMQGQIIAESSLANAALPAGAIIAAAALKRPDNKTITMKNGGNSTASSQGSPVEVTVDADAFSRSEADAAAVDTTK